jgi:hypothetical protein
LTRSQASNIQNHRQNYSSVFTFLTGCKKIRDSERNALCKFDICFYFLREYSYSFNLLLPFPNRILELLLPWNWVLLEIQPVGQLLKNYQHFHGTRRFITFFTRDFHRSLSWARWIKTISPLRYPSTIQLSIILFLVVSFLLAFPQSPYKQSPSPACMIHVCLLHPLWLDDCNCIWRKVKAKKLLIMKMSPTSCYFIPIPSKHSQSSSEILSVCVIPLIPMIKSHAHTKLQAKF